MPNTARQEWLRNLSIVPLATRRRVAPGAPQPLHKYRQTPTTRRAHSDSPRCTRVSPPTRPPRITRSPALPLPLLAPLPTSPPRRTTTRVHAAMATPSSSTTTPSPQLAFMQPHAPVTPATSATNSVSATDKEERDRAVQKFLARAEIGKVCARFPSDLSRGAAPQLPSSRTRIRALGAAVCSYTPFAPHAR